MRSRYDDISAALKAATFTIPNVTVREPYDESPKTYPCIVLHEIDNRPYGKAATVNGENRTGNSYQADIQTQSCVDTDGAVLSRWQAGRRLASEVDTIMDNLKVTRRTVTVPPNQAVDVLTTIWRGDVVLDSYGYAYRP